MSTGRIIPLKVGDFHQPLSVNDIGRGFKLNVASGEDCFKKKVFTGEMETAPMTGSTTVSEIITDMSTLDESMEINGKLGVSYGPMISGEGSGRYVQETVSNRRRAVVVYRTRQNAFFRRFKPGTLSAVKDVDEHREDSGYLTSKYGTKFIDTVVYGAQLDVTFTVTSQTDIDMDEIEAELKGKIGIGVLSIEFDAKFNKGNSSEEAQYNMSIKAEATGVLVTIPANPTFKQVTEIIQDFNVAYRKKFDNFSVEKDNPLLKNIEPVGFMLSNIADRIPTLDPMQVARLEDKMEDLEKVFRKTVLWKAKLNAIDSDLKERYERDHKQRVEMYNPYINIQRDAMAILEDKMDECITYRAKDLEKLIAQEVPTAYPSTGSPEEDVYRGLCGEYFFPSPVKIEGNSLDDVYYVGFAVKNDDKFVPWMDGTLKNKAGVTIATAKTPKDLLANYVSGVAGTYTPSKVWKELGFLNNIVLGDKLKEFPTTHYEYGATFNNANILPCTLSGWNGTTLYASITTPYLQGDNGTTLSFGSSVCARGTNDSFTRNLNAKIDTKDDFSQAYVSFKENANFGCKGGAYMQSHRSSRLYVRPFPFAWKKVESIKTESDYIALHNTYPHKMYAWGTDYNGHSIRDLTVTNWNKGLRIHTQVPYPQGDDVTTMKFGVASFTLGTDDEESKSGRFYHRYISLDTTGYGMGKETSTSGNGYVDIPIYVRKIGSDW